MRAQIEPDYETARKRYNGILEKILAYTDYCDEHGDESGEKYRELENELRAITGKDMSKFDLWEWWEADGAENLAFDIALPEPRLVPDITKDELREIIERMTSFEPQESEDEFLDEFYDRPNFACEGGYFTEFLKLNFKDTYDFKLFTRHKRNGVITELDAEEITQFLWGKRA